MNENELRRNQKVSRKLLSFLDKELELLISGRTFDIGKTEAGTLDLERIIALSAERRAIIRLLKEIK